MSSLIEALGERVEDLDGRALAGRLVEVERAIRELEAVALSIVASADQRQAYSEDGHVSVRGWVKATIRASDAEVMHRVRCAKLTSQVPACRDSLAAGRLGVAQLRELGRAFANPRCGELLGDVADTLVSAATEQSYEVFTQVVREWERLADADGAHQDAERAHKRRRASITPVGDTVYLDAQVGAAQGAAMTEVLERFTRAEFEADWAETKTRYGDAASPSLMGRSDPQRRADALAAIFQAAASTAPGSEAPEPVVNIIIDQAIYEAQLAVMATGQAPTFDASDLAHQRCRTTSGMLLDPADAVAASLVGHVRRVVLNRDGVIINLGRRERIFTGSARVAALLQAALDGDGRCIWLGCRNRRCQVDHSIDWSHGGPTDVANTGPLCPWHNRFKSRGYRTSRDPTGRWHIYRPDGTELEAA